MEKSPLFFYELYKISGPPNKTHLSLNEGEKANFYARFEIAEAGISPENKVSPSCSEELVEACCPIHQKSMDLHSVPSSWKNVIIRLLLFPKKHAVRKISSTAQLL